MSLNSKIQEQDGDTFHRNPGNHSGELVLIKMRSGSYENGDGEEVSYPKRQGFRHGHTYEVTADVAHHFCEVEKCADRVEPEKKPEKTREPKKGKPNDRSMDSPGGRK